MEPNDAVPLFVYLWSLGKTLAASVVTFGCFVFFTRYFDRRTRINWKSEAWPDIKDGNLAMGLYMGLRLLACALVSVAVGLAVR